MRHLVKGRKLNRNSAQRKALLTSLSISLINEHKIKTTLAKAKELRTFVEPLITKAKDDTMHNRRQVFSKLQNKEAVSHLFEEIAEEVMDRPGGYTRVIKIGNRRGDNAKMAVIELVDYNDVKPENGQKKSRTRRSGTSSESSQTQSSSQTTSDSQVQEDASSSKSQEKKASSEEE